MNKLLHISVFLFLSSTLTAQFAEKEYLTKKAYHESAEVRLVDFDNNGILDYFMDVPKIVDMNVGATQGFQIPLSMPYTGLAVNSIIDMNADGFLDIVALGANSLIIYINEGGLNFTPYQFSAGSFNHQPGFDFDEDGFTDIVVNGFAYLNDGTGYNFTNSNYNMTIYPNYYEDWNGDGSKDLIQINGSNMRVRYYVGPMNFATSVTVYTFDSQSQAANSTLRDIDGDGDLDILFLAMIIRANYNNGTGSVGSDQTILQVQNERYLASGDFDGNGLLDVAGVSTSNTSGPVFIRYNYGTSQFNTPKNLGGLTAYLFNYISNGTTRAFRIRDFDNDGKDELFFTATGGTEEVYWCTYDLSLSAPSNQDPEVVYTSSTENLRFLDYNGDGTKEIISESAGKFQVMYQASNDARIRGHQNFFTNPFVNSESTFSEFGDINGDGWLDAVYYRNSQQAKLIFSNEGAALDTLEAIQLTNYGVSEVRIYDINDDSHLDIIVRNSTNSSLEFFYGDGMGGFLNSGIQTTLGFTPFFWDERNVNFHDFDNNGLVDFLGSDFRVAYQLSEGQFSYNLSIENFGGGYEDVADVDGNGLLDILYKPSIGDVAVMYNYGVNDFIPGMSFEEMFGISLRSSAFIDFNNDGLEDILALVSDGGLGPPFTYNLYLNNGDGTWTPILYGEHSTRDFYVVDYDSDGDEDILFNYDSYYNSSPNVEAGLYWYENLSITDYLIKGTVFYDENQNGIKDVEENGVFGFNEINNGLGAILYSQFDGNYCSSYSEPGTYTITTLAPDGFIFTTPNEYSVELNATTPTVSNIDFGVYPAGLFTAGEADMVAFTPICDSQGAVYLQVSNTGTQNVPLEIILELPSYTELYQTSVAPSSTTDSTIVWTYEEFGIATSINIPVYLTYPGVQYIDSVFTYVYHVQIGDVYLTDTLEMGMLCAYDPNIKVEQTGWGEQGYFLDGQTLEYIVYFQNTGNYFATNVRLEDQLSDQLISSSVEVVSSSHTMETTLDPNGLLTFYFPNIMLPDSTSDPLGSIGFVKFRINHAPTVEPGDVIENYVDIYFDFNPEITTNTEINTMYDCELEGDNIPDASIDVVSNIITANEGFDYEWLVNDAVEAGFNENEYTATESGVYQVRVIDPNGCSEISEQVIINSVNELTTSTWSIFPNPTNDRFIISGIEQGNAPLIIYDMMGKKVMSINVSNGQEIDVNSLSAGIYVLMINGGKQRLVVER